MSAQNLFEISKEIPKEDLEEALQQAVQLEQATIPVYLYSYYSITRSWSQSGDGAGSAAQLRADIRRDIQAPEGTDVDELVRRLALDIQVYANKAGASIMAVVIEEMLHMALTSNVKQALFGPPDLYQAAKQLDFPLNLPGHEPDLPLDLAKFSLDQLLTFLRVESPLQYEEEPDLLQVQLVRFKTIGDFYKMLEQAVLEYYPGPYQNDRPQLIPGQNFYAQNTINTVYYDREHNPRFTNADDSGNLIHVRDCNSALEAMKIVVEQGEGHVGGDHLDEYGNPQCDGINWNDPSPDDFDDPDKEELSHFDKFLELYCQGQAHIAEFQELGLDFESYFVVNVPDNPKTCEREGHVSYASDPEIQATSELTNAIYTYLFLMVETCYYQKGNTQYELFMMGIHKSMIWVMSELAHAMRKWTFTTADGSEYHSAATFEWYDFGQDEASPKEQLVKLIKAAPNGDPDPTKNVAWWAMDYVATFPDVGLDHTVSQAPFIPTVTGQNETVET